MQFVPGYQNLDGNMFGDISPPPQHHSNLPSSSWLHVPPIQMPWGTPLAQQPNIVRFTADSSLSAVPGPSTSFGYGSAPLGAFQTDSFNNSNLQFKRRIENDEVPSPKKHITEEKMAAHMSLLSISGDGSLNPHPMSTEANEQDESTFSLNEDEQKGKRVILSKELRAMQKEPIIPPSLILKDKPSMALVLWKPPCGFLGEQLRTAARLNSFTTNGGERRNQQRQEQQLESTDNNNTPAAIDLNAFTTPQGDTIRDVEMEM